MNTRTITTIALLWLSIFMGSSGMAVPKNRIRDIDLKNKQMKKKVLMILTSHDALGDTGLKTGLWLEEFTTPYYALLDSGVEITLASPKGGKTPIDPKSELEESQTPSTRRFTKDEEAQKKLYNTIKLSEVDQDGYDALFYPGGHGPLWDLAEDKTSISLIEHYYRANKPVAAVCHGPAVFKNTKDSEGIALVHGRKVTGFSDSEEEAVQLTSVVPFSIEQMLAENGGIYSKENDWASYALKDGVLITGQNPASAEPVVDLLLKRLEE